MNQDVLQMWLQALRSGEYTQGHGVLRTEDDTYCCLGVVCDLHAKHAENAGVGWYHPEFMNSGWYYGDNPVELSDGVIMWLGLDPEKDARSLMVNREAIEAALGRKLENGEATPFTAIMLNDDLRMTFSQIADVLEATYA